MIILTGGAGFIGSCLLKYLNDDGHSDVLIVDNLSDSTKWKNLVGKNYIDYLNKVELFSFLEDIEPESIEAVIHLGACSSTTETDVDYLYDNNYRFSKYLLEFCQENNIRFIYASSAATYGMGEEGFSDEKTINLKPLNPYGFSKYLFDKFIVENELSNDVLGFRFFNVFGPNEYHKDNMASMVFKSYSQIVETGKIKLFKSNDIDFKDGEQLRDFIYIKDVCEVIIDSLKNKNINGIYNLGTGIARTWNDLAKCVFQSLKLDENIEYIDMPKDIIKQYQNYTEADMTKFQNSLLKRDFMTLEESVEDYIINYLGQGLKHI